MRMTGAQEYGNPVPGGCGESLSEGVEGRERPFRIDHIPSGDALRIGRDPTPVGHQAEQIPLPPGPLRIESDQHPGITGGEKPVTPQTLLPRGGHGPGETGGQQMGAQRTGTQHVNDADATTHPGCPKRGKNPTVGATSRTALAARPTPGAGPAQGADTLAPSPRPRPGLPVSTPVPRAPQAAPQTTGVTYASSPRSGKTALRAAMTA